MKLPISSEIVILRIELGIVMTMVISAAGGGGEKQTPSGIMTMSNTRKVWHSIC